MKTKEELNVLKEEVEKLNSKLGELSAEELAQVIGGIGEALGADQLLGIHCRDGQDLVGLNPHRRDEPEIVGLAPHRKVGPEQLVKGPTS